MIRFPIKAVWQSDWMGEEVGYPDSEVVGYYIVYTENQYGEEAVLNIYYDLENERILQAWFDEEEE